ncbi:hypothetical protein FCT18_13625 [Lysinibacillus sphaericus]|uniref:hypothetical protein n=1 Tax=Lysinibacillus sphaericus TaxID=1421 RepID=UPI0010BE7CB9|nr:hypothetical protein [Lysinibacillus sphaericus]MED4546394.1 hypothetical protein [Lysinibacillus sphaericus]TKI18546.1 hypothetical protein FCT18_13625 [Lysinibacillus sphaericus]GEC84541.1 hypothetical protein LSP03_42840 [Lysinibacillus sphaericus]
MDKQQTQHLTNYFAIGDLVAEASIALEKARITQQEIIDGYFSKWQPTKKKDHIYYAAHDFERYDVFARIAEDYMFEISKKITELEKKLKEYEKVAKEESSEQSSEGTTHETNSQIVSEQNQEGVSS